MRRKTELGIPFSFAFVSYNRQKNITEGIVYVQKAILRPAASSEDIENAEHKLFYTDLSTFEPRNCWQPLLVFYNEQKLEL